ncbi:MAG TPA: DUF4349 domain-containing protein [Candidatus Limnocylindria bacterium]|nr:DUF4349 domain-containing protein [Candidatus Limnocylindria bacterium]
MRRLVLVMVALAALLLAACGQQGAGASGQDAGGQPLPAASEAAAADEERTATSGDGAAPEPDDFYAAPVEQRIIKTGEVTLEVQSVPETLGLIRAMVAQLNGYVGGSQAGTLGEGASLTVRIPAASFDDALARLHELDADVKAEATREENVTTQVVDLRARIDNLQASEASYRELVARAEKIEDILAVQSRLDEVRGQIEQLTAQLEALEGQAAMSTLTITLVPRLEPVTQQTEEWNPGQELGNAVAALVGIGQGLLNALIWFGVVWLPILLLLGIVALIVLRGVIEARRRMEAPRHMPPVEGPSAS